MAQSLSKVIVHLVFSTKNRAPMILPSLAPELHAYLAGTCSKHGSNAYRVGGVENHVHIACALSRTEAVADLVRDAKAASSSWMRKRGPQFAEFAWQAGYGAFSIGQSQLPALVRYIARQEEHHGGQSYEDEFRGLLRLYEIEFDERHVWD